MAHLGLSEHEVRSFSVVRAIRALYYPEVRQFQQEAAFEYDVSAEAARIDDRPVTGILIPDDVLHSKQVSKRALNATTDASGKHTVDDEIQSIIDIFIESTFAAENVSVLTGIQGNVTLPGQDDRVVAGWTAEQAAATEDEMSFRQVTFTPRHVRSWLRVTKQLLVQAHGNVEMLLRRDLARAIAKAVDRALLYGTGSNNQPTGISVEANINSDATWTAGDTKVIRDGLIAKVLDAEELLAENNVPDQNGRQVGKERMCKILMSPRMRRRMKSAQFFGENTDIPLLDKDDMLLGEYMVYTSTQVDTDDFFYADWKDAVLALWSGIEIMENPYSEDRQGIIRITTDQMCDVGVLRPKSFYWLDGQ